MQGQVCPGVVDRAFAVLTAPDTGDLEARFGGRVSWEAVAVVVGRPINFFELVRRLRGDGVEVVVVDFESDDLADVSAEEVWQLERR